MAILTRGISKALTKQHLPETVFFGIAIISVVTLIVPLWNYTELYTALYDFNYTLQGPSLNTSQLSTHTARINFTLVATNPTRYSGLQVSSIVCRVDYYVADNLRELITLYTTKVYPIGPNSNATILFDFTINPDTAAPYQFDAFREFISYLSQVPGEQIGWFLTFTLTVHTAMGGTLITKEFPTPLS